MRKLIPLAVTVATRAHHGQFRKDGTPYIAHPMRVAMRLDVSGLSAEDAARAYIVALLHDVVEDTSVTIEELREIGFDATTLAAIESVTKRPGAETYMEFVARSKADRIGRVVKLADIEDNTEDQSALDPDEAEFLSKRYTRAKKFLLED